MWVYIVPILNRHYIVFYQFSILIEIDKG